MFVVQRARRLFRKIVEIKRQNYLRNLMDRGLKMGRNVTIVDTCFFDPSHCFLISIGDNTTICPNVRLIAHDASTKKLLGYTKIGLINIKENCFIGDSVIILPNVTIGPNAIIGAGSVVTKDIPADSVAAGNPARVICPVEDYIEKIGNIARGKTIFDCEYSVDVLDEEHRGQITGSLGRSIGFIL